MYSLVYTRVVDHVYKQFRRAQNLLAPELRNVSSSVTSATVCTITMIFGETSDEGQELEPTIIEFMVLTACLFNMEMEIFPP